MKHPMLSILCFLILQNALFASSYRDSVPPNAEFETRLRLYSSDKKILTGRLLSVEPDKIIFSEGKNKANRMEYSADQIKSINFWNPSDINIAAVYGALGGLLGGLIWGMITYKEPSRNPKKPIIHENDITDAEARKAYLLRNMLIGLVPGIMLGATLSNLGTTFKIKGRKDKLRKKQEALKGFLGN